MELINHYNNRAEKNPMLGAKYRQILCVQTVTVQAVAAEYADHYNYPMLLFYDLIIAP